MDHKLRELNTYIRALDVLTEATKSFRSCDQLLDPGQDIEVLKLEIQLQTVKHYLLRDENDVYPSLTYINTKQVPAPAPAPAEIQDAFAVNNDANPPPPEFPPPEEEEFQPPPPPGSPPGFPPKFQRKFSRGDLERESTSGSLDSELLSHTQSLPSSFDEKKHFACLDFSNIGEKFGYIESENIPTLIATKSKSEPQSPRRRKSSTSRMRKSGSGRHKWDFFTPEAIAKSFRKRMNKKDEDDDEYYREKEKSRSWPKNGSRSRSNRGSNRSSKEKEQTPWDIVNTLNQNHQDLMCLIRVQEESLAQINQILN